MSTEIKESNKTDSSEKTKCLTYGKARDLYMALKELTFEGLPDAKVTPALLIVAGLTNVVDSLESKLTALKDKKPKELELTKEDIAKLRDEEEQLSFSIARTNWENSLNEAVKALFDEETTIPLEECRILTKEEFESYLKANKKKLSMQASVSLINHLVQK